MLLRDVCDHTKVFKLENGTPLLLGRNRETQIKDIRCSRVQLIVTPNYEERNVLIEQAGTNSSALNGVPFYKGEKRKAEPGSVVEILESKYFFKIECITELPKPTVTVNNECFVEDNTEANGIKRLGSLEHFLKDSTFKKKGTWKHIHEGSLLVFTSVALISREKIAAFDLDGTIITTNSGNVFPKDHNDWKLAFPEVSSKLRELNKNGYKLILFTNQGGIGKGKIKISDFHMKIEAITRKLEVPMQIFISTMDDKYRKPRIEMWNFMIQNENDNLKVNYDESFYCGDAAGRPANCEPNKNKKDFSLADRLFALNLNLKFFTPEEYFVGWKTPPFDLPEFRPFTLSDNGPLIDPPTSKLSSKHQEIVIMIGCPGSGKSFFAKSHLEKAGYVYINRDTLKTWQKCVSLTENSVKNKLSVVIDNTNPDKISRARYIAIAQEYNIPIRAFWMSTSLNHAKHNNTFRQLLNEDHHDFVPNHSINHFFNILETPSLEEGFKEIVRVNFIPKFQNEEKKKLYNLYLLEM